jgi:L-alanine-DL-glutamate epimerase-like enolase superfamily enzyme
VNHGAPEARLDRVDDHLSARELLRDGWMTLPDQRGIGFLPDPEAFAPSVAEHWRIEG